MNIAKITNVDYFPIPLTQSSPSLPDILSTMRTDTITCLPPSTSSPHFLAYISKCFLNLSYFFPNHPWPFLLQYSGQLLAGSCCSFWERCVGSARTQLPRSCQPASRIPFTHLHVGLVFSLSFPSPQRLQEVILYLSLIYLICRNVSEQTPTSSPSY